MKLLLWTLGALAGVVLAAGVTYAASSLSTQRIGISSEPVSAGQELAPKATAIVAFSELGLTARLISKQRPAAPIIAFTPFEPVRRQMALFWGVQPHTMQEIAQTDERVDEAERRLKTEGLVKSGERIVVLSGTSIGKPGGTNLIKLQEVE